MDNQERQQLLDQYAEIATLAGGLAHEIRNPLSTIGMNLELLAEELDERDDPLDRRMLTKVERIQAECDRLDDILTAFLQFARIGQLELSPGSLNDVVAAFIEFYQPMATEHGIELSPHLAPDLPAVLLDASLLRQVLMNLAINAQQAMPDGGTLELQTACGSKDVQLSLIDTGIGMDRKAREKMFETFFSTKQGGSGLGLPTVRKIVEAHGGSITCDSEPGQGTRFTVSLPVATTDTVHK